MNQSNIRIDNKTREETDESTESFARYRTTSFLPFGSGVRTFPWHWHPEVECFYIREGSLTYHIPGQECTYRAGDVGFVNSGVLHMLSDTGEQTTNIQNHIFLPQMICGNSMPLESKYVAPLVLNTAASLMVFHAETEEAAQMRQWMDEAHNAHMNQDFAYEFTVRDCMSRIWNQFLKVMPASSTTADSRDLQRLITMLQYIAAHYSEKLELSSIAGAAHISIKECERCFQKQIRTTPFDYIKDYRLEKARDLLQQDTNRSITEIGQSCGYTTTSYFGKCFKEKYGLSPRDYRKFL